MTSISDDLSEQIRRLDMTIENQRSAIKDLREDTDFPHILQKRQAELLADRGKLAEKMLLIDSQLKLCETRLNRELAELRLAEMAESLQALKAKRAELFTRYQSAAASDQNIKAVASDIKQFSKLAESLPKEMLEAMLKELLLKKAIS